MGEIRIGQQLELVELIYSAGLDPSEWETVVARLGELLPHAAVAFQMVDLLQKSPTVCLIGENWEGGPRALEAYSNHFAAISPWVPVHHSARVGVPYVSDRTCPVSSYRSSEFYADFIKPYKVMTGAVAVKLFDDAKRMATLGMNYHEDQGDRVLEPMEQLLKDLVPHLRRAIEMNRKFLQMEVRSQSMEGMLDRIAFPAFIVNADGVVRHMNQPALAAVGQRRGVSLTPDGRIAHERSEETAQLRRLIASAAVLDQASPDVADGFVAFTVSGEPDPNMAWVTPLIAGSNQSLLHAIGGADREVLVTLQYRREVTPIPHEQLIKAFGLTEAESQVVIALAKGMTLGEYAEQSGRSIHTIRLHLKRALAKTDCRTQAALVALVMRTVGQLI